jgi:hypothetical protein
MADKTKPTKDVTEPAGAAPPAPTAPPVPDAGAPEEPAPPTRAERREEERRRRADPGIRGQGDAEEAARLSREAAADAVGVPGRNLFGVFDPQAIAKALKIPAGVAEKVVDVFLARGEGSAVARVNVLVVALDRIARGEEVDGVINDLVG